MNVSQEFLFRTATAVIWLAAIFVVLMAHKWSIEGMHKRLKEIESKLNMTEEVTQ